MNRPFHGQVWRAPWPFVTRHHPPAIRTAIRAGSLVLIALLVLGTLSLAVGTVAARISRTVGRYTSVAIPKIPVGPQTTFVYDRNGHLVTTLHAAVNRTLVPLSHISLNLQHAVIAIEDKDFYHHGAISASSIFRAAIANAVSGKIEQGGSTITQQYVKNVFTGDERTLSRKIHEAVLAVKLEHQYSKNQILGMYLNTVYFGHGAYGAQAAAQTYFGVPASKLSVLQSATLAGLVAAPGAFDPVADRRAARDRRNEVLDVMAQQGYLTPASATKLAAKPIRVPGLHDPDQTPYPYFMQYVTQYLLSHRGYDQTFEGGLRVTTTLDQADQRAAEHAVLSHLPSPMEPDAALVAIDPSTGAIRAMVGGRNFAKYKFNLAWQAHRQAGSAFKTFTLTAAMEQGISLQSVWNGPPQLTITDPRCFDPVKQKPWDVANYADESAGTMPLVDAIANSVNTIFAQVVTVVGPDKVANVAHRLGIRSKLEPVCSITLGSQAVTPLDMADAYATLAAGGIHHVPIPVTKITTAGGKMLARPNTTGNRAIGPNVAALVSYALQGVVEHGTGTAANIGRPVAGKTGTGQDYRDAWFCGYTPQLAACVWVGYRKGEIPMHNVGGFSDVFGGSIPAEIWHDFMASAMSGQPVQDFPTPDFSHNTKFPSGTTPAPPSPSPSFSPHPHPTHTHKTHSPHGPSPSPSDGAGTGAAAGAGAPLAGVTVVAVLVGLARVRARGRHRRRRRR